VLCTDAQEGQPAVVSVPQLTDPDAPTNGGGAAALVHLAPDLATLDAERLILQAAAANAAIQLGTFMHLHQQQ
jgi:hypothetical protein